MIIAGGISVALDQRITFGSFKIFTDHFGDEITELGFRDPTHFFSGLARVTDQTTYLSWAEITWIDAYNCAPNRRDP